MIISESLRLTAALISLKSSPDPEHCQKQAMFELFPLQNPTPPPPSQKFLIAERRPSATKLFANDHIFFYFRQGKKVFHSQITTYTKWSKSFFFLFNLHPRLTFPSWNEEKYVIWKGNLIRSCKLKNIRNYKLKLLIKRAIAYCWKL